MKDKTSKRIKYITSSSLFFCISIVLVIMYTYSFGTLLPPFEYTISYIGNRNIESWIGFLIWGIITMLCVSTYVLYTFKKANFNNPKALKYLKLSNVCIVLTVITPSLPEVLPILSKIHTLYSIFIVVFFLAAMILFVKYMYETNGKLPKYVIYAMILTVAIPGLTLFFMGINSFVEMSILILVSILFIVLNIYLNSIHKLADNKN